MFPFSRPEVRPLSPRPLSPEILALLRGLPAASSPDGLRTRLLAAHAREGRAPRGAFSLAVAGAWDAARPGLVAGALTAGLGVVALGGATGGSRDAESPRLSAMVGSAPREVAEARVSVIDEVLIGGAAGERLEPIYASLGAPDVGGP
jgi:hypothetical protein